MNAQLEINLTEKVVLLQRIKDKATLKAYSFLKFYQNEFCKRVLDKKTKNCRQNPIEEKDCYLVK